MKAVENIFNKESQDNLRRFEVKSDDDLLKAESNIETFVNESKRIYSIINSRISEMQEDFTLDVKNGSHIDSYQNKDIKVIIGRDRVLIRFVYDLEKDKCIDTELSIADKWKVYDYNDRTKEEMIKKGITLGCVYSLRIPGCTIDVSKSDSPDEAEVAKIFNFIGKEFRNRKTSELMLNIEKFFLELNEYWDYNAALDTTVHRLRDTHNAYLLAKCIEKARGMNLLKVDNVIMVPLKRREFVEFNAYRIMSIGHKYVTYEIHVGIIEYNYKKYTTEEYEYRHYVKIKSNVEKKYANEEFIKMVGEHIHNEGNAEIYTLEEWNDFQMLNQTEKDNMVNSKILSKELQEINDRYQILREK